MGNYKTALSIQKTARIDLEEEAYAFARFGPKNEKLIKSGQTSIGENDLNSFNLNSFKRTDTRMGNWKMRSYELVDQLGDASASSRGQRRLMGYITLQIG